MESDIFGCACSILMLLSRGSDIYNLTDLLVQGIIVDVAVVVEAHSPQNILSTQETNKQWKMSRC